MPSTAGANSRARDPEGVAQGGELGRLAHIAGKVQVAPCDYDKAGLAAPLKVDRNAAAAAAIIHRRHGVRDREPLPRQQCLTNRTLRPPQAGSPSAPTRSRRRPRIRGWRVISPSIRDRTALPGTTGAPPPPPPTAEEAASASARPLSTRDRATYAATSRGATANSARKDSPARSGPPPAGAAASGIVRRSAAPAPRLVDAERHLRRRRRLGRDKVVECRRHASPVRLRPVGRSRKGRKHARVRL